MDFLPILLSGIAGLLFGIGIAYLINQKRYNLLNIRISSETVRKEKAQQEVTSLQQKFDAEKEKNISQSNEITKLTTNLDNSKQQYRQSIQKSLDLQKELNTEKEKNTTQSNEITELTTNLRNLKEQYKKDSEKKETEFNLLKENALLEFKNVANKLFTEKKYPKRK